jgi:hypothetical protein
VRIHCYAILHIFHYTRCLLKLVNEDIFCLFKFTFVFVFSVEGQTSNAATPSSSSAASDWLSVLCKLSIGDIQATTQTNKQPSVRIGYPKAISKRLNKIDKSAATTVGVVSDNIDYEIELDTMDTLLRVIAQCDCIYEQHEEYAHRLREQQRHRNTGIYDVCFV